MNTITYPDTNYVTVAPQPIFFVEAVPGGFIVNLGGQRQVARNVHAVARLLREWAPKPEAKPES
jgi:hypothetical protein